MNIVLAEQPIIIEEPGVYFWHLNSQLVYGDRTVAAIYGLEEKDVLSGVDFRVMMECIDPADRSRIAKTMKRVIATCGSYFEEYLVMRGGETIRVQSSGRCFMKDGQPSFYSGIIYPLPSVKENTQQTLVNLCAEAHVLASDAGFELAGQYLAAAITALDKVSH